MLQVARDVACKMLQLTWLLSKVVLHFAAKAHLRFRCICVVLSDAELGGRSFLEEPFISFISSKNCPNF